MFPSKVRGQVTEKQAKPAKNDPSTIYRSITLVVMGGTYRVDCSASLYDAIQVNNAYDVDVRIIDSKYGMKVELLSATPVAK